MRSVWTHPTSGEKGRGSHISLAAALSQGFIWCVSWMRLPRIPDTYVLHAFQTRLARACERFLGAELYHNIITRLFT